jgi:hypothetical protein
VRKRVKFNAENSIKYYILDEEPKAPPSKLEDIILLTDIMRSRGFLSVSEMRNKDLLLDRRVKGEDEAP